MTALLRHRFLGDTAYGNNYKFRHGITELGLSYVLGVQGTTTVWKPGQGPLPPKSLTGRGRTPTRMQRNKKHQPVSVKQLALSLSSPALEERPPGAKAPPRTLRSRFAAVRIRPRSSGSRAPLAASERVVVGRVAQDRIRTDPVLALHSWGPYLAFRSGRSGQTALDHRTRLSGTQAGTRSGTLRRSRLAWISPSWHLMYCLLWVPGRRAEPIFPLCICRACWTIRPQTPQTLQTPRNPGSGPNDITPARLPRFAFASPAS